MEGNPLLSYIGDVGRAVTSPITGILGMNNPEEGTEEQAGLLDMLGTGLGAVRPIVTFGANVSDAIDSVYGPGVEHNMREFKLLDKIWDPAQNAYVAVRDKVLNPLMGVSAQEVQDASISDPSIGITPTAESIPAPSIPAPSTPSVYNISPDAPEDFFPVMDSYGQEMNLMGPQPQGDEEPPQFDEVNPIDPEAEPKEDEADEPNQSAPDSTTALAVPHASIVDFTNRKFRAGRGRTASYLESSQSKLRELLENQEFVKYLNSISARIEEGFFGPKVVYDSGRRVRRGRGNIISEEPVNKFVDRMSIEFAPANSPSNPVSPANPVSQERISQAIPEALESLPMVRTMKILTSSMMEAAQQAIQEGDISTAESILNSTPEGKAIVDDAKASTINNPVGFADSGTITADTTPVTGYAISPPMLTADTTPMTGSAMSQPMVSASTMPPQTQPISTDYTPDVQSTEVDTDLLPLVGPDNPFIERAVSGVMPPEPVDASPVSEATSPSIADAVIQKVANGEDPAAIEDQLSRMVDADIITQDEYDMGVQALLNAVE